ncbi:MAG TPA: hypothetical protein VHS58_19840 [Acetobacteraceae bacterium]|jgi:hypothetical protein|nr:hypothetical protein [Acetobacteraceae bacterium]
MKRDYFQQVAHDPERLSGAWTCVSAVDRTANRRRSSLEKGYLAALRPNSLGLSQVSV